jgi:predicted nucleotidyltransferase
MLNLKETILLVQEWAKTDPYIYKVWVFGSYAKGTQHEQSDFDVAVQLDPDILSDEQAYLYWSFDDNHTQDRLRGLIQIQLDLQLYSLSDTPLIVSYVSESGILVYEKPSH